MADFASRARIRDALNAQPRSSASAGSLERKKTRAFRRYPGFNNLSIIGLEGHRATEGGEGEEMEDWTGCQDPAQLGQNVERVAPVNVRP